MYTQYELKPTSPEVVAESIRQMNIDGAMASSMQTFSKSSEFILSEIMYSGRKKIVTKIIFSSSNEHFVLLPQMESGKVVLMDYTSGKAKKSVYEN